MKSRKEEIEKKCSVCVIFVWFKCINTEHALIYQLYTCCVSVQTVRPYDVHGMSVPNGAHDENVDLIWISCLWLSCFYKSFLFHWLCTADLKKTELMDTLISNWNKIFSFFCSFQIKFTTWNVKQSSAAVSQGMFYVLRVVGVGLMLENW